MTLRHGHKIISWNLLHWSGATLEQVKGLISQYNPDLLLMQEATALIDPLPFEIGGNYVRNTLPDRSHGLAAWSPKPFYAPAYTLSLQPGLIIRRISQIIDMGDYVVANVHLSHGQVLNRRQLRRLAKTLPHTAVIMGDCNLLGPSLLKDFSDVGPRQTTHYLETVESFRLDRCFIRGLSCESAEVLDRGNSDHRPIIVQLSSALVDRHFHMAEGDRHLAKVQ